MYKQMDPPSRNPEIEFVKKFICWKTRTFSNARTAGKRQAQPARRAKVSNKSGLLLL